MPKPPLVCDTSLLLYLGRIAQTAILPAFFEPVYVPDSVTLELSAGWLLQPDIIDPQTLEWVVSVDEAIFLGDGPRQDNLTNAE
jgi:hypothetical protein